MELPRITCPERFGSLVRSIVDIDELRRVGQAAGLDDVSVAGVAPIVEAQMAIEERKSRGLHGGMNFTFGNPARAANPGLLFNGAKTVVVALRRYRAPSPTPAVQANSLRVRPRGEVAAYVRSDEYGALREGLRAIELHLQAAGAKTEIVFDDNRLADRAVAAKAGLGWLARNTMLIHPQLGSWTVIGSLVTDLEIGEPAEGLSDGCGSCRRCSTDCPTGALGEFGVLDANKCLAWLLQAKGAFPRDFRRSLGGRIYGCDDCQVTCPYNESSEEAASASYLRSEGVDILKLLKASDSELMDEFGHWYIPRRRPEYLRRNALVVLGNIGDPGDPEVAAVLETCLVSDEPLVRSHAIWAALRLGKEDLVKRNLSPALLRNDPEGIVTEELLFWNLLHDVGSA